MKSFAQRNLCLLLILGATIFVYAHSLKNGFVNLDDSFLVYTNPWVTKPSLHSLKTFFTSYDPELYVPLTFITYQVDYLLWGLNPFGYHLTSLLLHLGSVALLFFIVQKLFDTQRKRKNLWDRNVPVPQIFSFPLTATLVTALFALHPINTETIAWVSARKDVLSGFLMLATILSYLRLREAKQGTEASQRSHISIYGNPWSWLTLILFILALLAKVTAVTIPALLLLIDWLQQRFDSAQRDKIWWWKHIRKKLPLILLALAAVLIAMYGKSTLLSETSLWEKILMAHRSVIFYLAKLLLPIHQSVLYPVYEPISLRSPLFFLPIIIFWAITALVIVFVKTRREFFFAWAFFLIALIPSFAHFDRGGAHIFVGSERYAYIASIGAFLLLAFILESLLERLPSISRSGGSPPQTDPRPRKMWIFRHGFILCLFIPLSTLSYKRSLVWADSIVFNQDILRTYPREYKAHYNLGFAYDERGLTEWAEREYLETVRLSPGYADAYLNLGIIEAKRNNYPKAISYFNQAMMYEPVPAKANYNLGLVYQNLGQWDRSIWHYRQAIRLKSFYKDARLNLATVYGKQRRFAEALEQYGEIAKMEPAFAKEIENLVKNQQ